MTDRAMAPFHFAQVTNTLAGDGAAKDAGGLLRRYGLRCIEVHETVNAKENAHE